MKIAVTYENGDVYQHFGHTQQFKLYSVEENKVVSSEIVDTNGQGHGALANFLANYNVDTMICGGIGKGAQVALGQMGIQIFGGVQGNADQVIEKFLEGTLVYNPDVQCNHHEGHDCGEHGCKH